MHQGYVECQGEAKRRVLGPGFCGSQFDQQPLRRRSDFLDCRLEGSLILFRGLPRAAYLSNELEGGGGNFVLGRLRFSKNLDAAAHRLQLAYRGHSTRNSTAGACRATKALI